MSDPSSPEPLLPPRWIPFLEIVARLFARNPFEPAWEELVRAALGDAYVPGDDAGNRRRIMGDVGPVVAVAAEQLEKGAAATPEELATYQGLALWVLWEDYGPRLQKLIDAKKDGVPWWDAFEKRCKHYLGHPGLVERTPEHVLGVLYQERRIWHFARTLILGASARVNAARADLFRASMGGDPLVYMDGLYKHIHELPVLITGETGTGKELAARCLGWSRYLPFDKGAKRFVARYDGDFHAVNLCEFPRELRADALVGHKKGAFSGATADKAGYFSAPGPHGTLLVDEVGELPLEAQAALLRPLQERVFVVLGEVRPRPIHAQLMFATNKDLEAMCRTGEFRRDLLERMKVLRIHMPPLRAILAGDPGERRVYVQGFVARRFESAAMVERMTDRIVAYLRVHRADDPWEGNLRELGNFVEHFIVTDGQLGGPEMEAAASVPAAASPKEAESPPAPSRRRPVAPESAVAVSSSNAILGPAVKAGRVTVWELLRAYVTWMFVLAGQSKAETARRTGMTWRKVAALIDPVRLARWVGRRTVTAEPPSRRPG